MTKIDKMIEELSVGIETSRDGNVTISGSVHAELKSFCKDRGLKIREVVEWLIQDLLHN